MFQAMFTKADATKDDAWYVKIVAKILKDSVREEFESDRHYTEQEESNKL